MLVKDSISAKISYHKPGGGGGGGGYSEKFVTGVCGSGFRWPLAKEILVENIPLAKENFLIMSSFLHDFKGIQSPNIPF